MYCEVVSEFQVNPPYRLGGRTQLLLYLFCKNFIFVNYI